MGRFVKLKSFTLLVLVTFCTSISEGDGTGNLLSVGPLASDIFTISGFSSGAAKALQIYLSHSSQIKGIGMMSGLMYRCESGFWPSQPSFGVVEIARLLQCSLATFDYNKVVEKIRWESKNGLLDPLQHISWGKQYLHSGSNDIVVLDKSVEMIAKFFRECSSNVIYNHTDIAHGFPTEMCGPSCATNIPPLPRTSCRSCGWDGAFTMLNFLYDDQLIRRVPPKETRCSIFYKGEAVPGLFEFSQGEFFPPGSEGKINMAAKGYIYVPEGCQKVPSSCHLHVHLHGCGHAASLPFVNTDDIRCTGILRVAEANNLIVLFPQTRLAFNSVSGLGQCWDFVGYTGPDYGNKKGSQVQAVMAMVYRILGKG